MRRIASEGIRTGSARFRNHRRQAIEGYGLWLLMGQYVQVTKKGGDDGMDGKVRKGQVWARYGLLPSQTLDDGFQG